MNAQAVHTTSEDRYTYIQVKDELKYRAGVADGSITPGLGPFGKAVTRRGARNISPSSAAGNDDSSSVGRKPLITELDGHKVKVPSLSM
jgi:hypothetical protein